MTAHQWQFFRSGGFDQVRLDRISDWQALAELDQKLWAALACPTQGLEFDARTLAYIDADGDGRVRVPEVLAAVKWALSVLKQPEVLLSGDALPLAAINEQHPEGAKLLASAREIVANLGKTSHQLSVDDTADLGKIFPANRPNGDGIVPAELSDNAEVKQLIADVIATLGGETDRSGVAGVSQAKLDAFVAAAKAFVDWQRAGGGAELPFGGDTAGHAAALAHLRAKIDDYFVRCDLASYDARAVTALNGSDADLAAIGTQLLNTDSAASEGLPLARIEAGRALPLNAGINPAWQAELDALKPLLEAVLGKSDSLSKAGWEAVKAKLAPYQTWQANKPESPVNALGGERLSAILSSTCAADLAALIIYDRDHADEAAEIVSVDKLVRYQRYLRVLLNNFVNFRDFFARKDKAVFQNGTLFIDGRSCDLVVRVNDAGKHGALAGLSRAYLLYCDCVRKKTGEKITIVAAVTAGDAGNLMVGRNGIYYDRAGNDWDATVSKIVENPISVREAFFTPYRRIARMISEQAQKFAASKDKAIEEKSAAGVTDATGKVTSGEKPAPAAPFDVAKFAGIFAAIGLAIGAIGTALAAVVSGFLALEWWQMPLALVGGLLLVSGPSMIMAWFKLRQRNLGPILDANGWAVNSMVKINIPFGTALTSIAALPAGSERALTDPYAEKRSRWPWLVLLLVLSAAGVLWYKGILQGWLGIAA
ncbi:MAG: hypothetical protein ACK4E7_05205 [Permianibacter sp.]